MTRAVIIAKGIVQGVGFRYTVRNVAFSLGINGCVKNLDNDSVEIIAEGTRPNIDSLVQGIRNAKEPAMVTDVSVSYEEVPDEFESFKIVAGDLTREIIEGFGTGDARFSQANKKLDQMLDKQDQMLDKQDQMLDKQDQTVSEIRSLSNSMHDMMDMRFQRLEGEIRLIKEKIGL